MSNFSERLKEFMQDFNFTQRELERKTSVPRTNISDYLNKNHMPSYDALVKLLYFFNCSADFILGLDEIPTEEKLHPVLDFSERLKQILANKNISQEKLKRELPVSGSVLYRWVSGKSLPTPTSLIRLSEYLDCSVDFLIGRRR